MNNVTLDYQKMAIFDGDDYLKYLIKDDALIIKEKTHANELLLGIAFLIANFLKLEKIIDQDKIFNLNDYYFKRIIKIGELASGKLNAITDIEDVLVGMVDVKDNDFNTGITLVYPHSGNIFQEKVVASTYVFNGFGKSVGLVQIDELGSIETPIAMTTTLNIGKVLDAMQAVLLDENPNVTSINPIVLECNDGELNDSRKRVLDKSHLDIAIQNKTKYVLQGDYGAGAGMICHGFKGGIGTSSRTFTINGKEYSIGIILNSNFGSANASELIIKGRKMKPLIEEYLAPYADKGSIVGVVATDLPVNERQLKRLLKRVELGIAKTGSFAGNGSGDLFVGFTTKNKITKPFDEKIERIADNDLNIAFKAIVEMSEEATLNSMLFAHHIKGYKKEVKSILEYLPTFVDLLDIEIIKK